MTLIPLSVYQWIGLVLIVAGAIPSTVFTFYYGLAVDWWRSREGVHLFGFTATVALLLDLSLLLKITGLFPGVLILALVIYAAIAVFMWQRLWMLRRAQSRN